jgi:hypothetical protein
MTQNNMFMSIILTPFYYALCLTIINIIILGLSYPILIIVKNIFVNNNWMMITIFNLYATSWDNLTLFMYSITGIFSILNIIISVCVFSLFYITKKYVHYETKKNNSSSESDIKKNVIV